MKKIFLILALCLNTFALPLDAISNTMQKNIDESLKFLQNSKENKKEAADKIFALFNDIIDYKLMAKLSLSKNYFQLSSQEQEQFSLAFESSLKKSFTDKLSLYKDQILKVKKGELKNENRYFLNASMIVDGEEKNIVFKFYNDNNNWLIYDIDVLGVSIVQTYRSQFKDILAHQGFDSLLKKLENITLE
ncbi:toluene tolerance protein [Campylobacter hepaticus]|uniref:Toluene tolerance protein n=1 Tax=Campylobacter hepaticus TaxID=1813019 RepID=A0A6A7JSW8_9BACT|nr:ABC transporter substrate-binding protein [Campylobacter hepaticus]AXP08992.1 toluene tolerance protein [Campylobacter hepaticus]MDX2323696.1 ABC transporter substrate-binding protein [Campylobacter hepaticus]MDX2331631.1 ABC transporter substrate-binding protein [Campylobacter hepaticus]MDX2333024.1 ABC transporter substrate-binding protein [Campylobacter hepaticus]MDX2372217.1 ABC transporter substrate-binding protein [Campylobacter hepaticus]